jgi:hypothetical protein
MAKVAPLRLLAEDADDLAVMSAALQDAVAKLGDIRWETGSRRLTIAFNRFRWEALGKTGGRVRAGLQIGGVMSVQARNLRQGAPAAVVELLSLAFEPGESPGGVVQLTFAGDGELRCEVECLDAVLADLSQPWPARGTPAHET